MHCTQGAQGNTTPPLHSALTGSHALDLLQASQTLDALKQLLEIIFSNVSLVSSSLVC